MNKSASTCVNIMYFCYVGMKKSQMSKDSKNGKKKSNNNETDEKYWKCRKLMKKSKTSFVKVEITKNISIMRKMLKSQKIWIFQNVKQIEM